MDVPLFIHPINPQHVDGMWDFRLVALTGFLFDTCILNARVKLMRHRPHSVRLVEPLDISEDDKLGILGGNALGLVRR